MWSSLGVKFVSPDLAMQAFDKLMHRHVEQIAVAVADWPTYAGKVGRPPFLAELMNRNEFFGSSKTEQEKVVPDAPPVAVNGQADCNSTSWRSLVSPKLSTRINR
jgi:hypothetical protein